MRARNRSIPQRMRVLLLSALVALALGGIAYSHYRISHAVDGTRISESAVTELSLTHSIERTSGGRLTSPDSAVEEGVPQPEPKASKSEAGRLVAPGFSKQQDQVREMANKKSIGKKPAPKKPTPKKPAPKKPKGKKRGKGACPT